MGEEETKPTEPEENAESAKPTETGEVDRRASEDSIAVIMQDRRKYEGGNDGEGSNDARDPADIPKSELMKRAKVHMLSTACTKWDDKEKCYKFLPVWGTTRRELGILGLGVQLYFQFLCQMGCVFLILTILTLPLLVTNAMGDLVASEGSQQVFGQMSIANLGKCGDSGALCRTAEEIANREAGLRVSFFGLDEHTQVRDVTSVFGTLDGVALLVFMSFGLFFAKYWVPHEMRVHDGVHLTAGDFSLKVSHLPRKLPGDEHKDYEKLLTEHFSKILRDRCDVQDEKPVHDVVLVREYKGAIDNYIVQGQYLLQKRDLQVRMKAAESDEQRQKVQKQIDNINKRIVKMENSFGANAGKLDSDRNVMGDAFVTFNKDVYVDKILYEYRFARSRIFRFCLDPALRFYGARISVDVAPEPSDLLWENLDYHRYWRRVRLGATCLMTFIILVVCLIALLYCKMIGVSTGAAAPSADLWVIKTMQNTDCLTLCDWTLYSDSTCSSQAGLGSIVNYRDATGSLLAANPLEANCSSGFWESPACSAAGVVPPSQAQWVGVQFSDAISVACMQFQQNANGALWEAELYACSSTSLASLSAWTPEEHCIGLQDLSPSTVAQGSFSASGHQRVLTDASCRRAVSYEAAVEGLRSKTLELEAADSSITDEHAHYLASASDPTMHCYCTQQQTVEGFAAFRFGSLDTPARQLCVEWIYYHNVQLTMMSVGVVAVCTLNLLLVLIFSYFVLWEKHSSFSSQNSSQFLKLFFAQFMNTALIVLLVNANFRRQLDDVFLVTMFGFGQGAYDDFSRGWFVQVGSSFVLSAGLQVITATTPGIIMSYVVNPLFILFFRMGLATQKVLNQVYVYPEWSMSNRLAQSMTVFFVILMYSGGMPILNFVGCLYCFTAYWMDKWCLLRGSLKPPAYSGKLLKLSAELFPIGAFLHALVTLWCFGNQNTFPSEWSVLEGFYGGLIDMDTSRYSSIIAQYNSAAEELRNLMFWDYLHARALDMARWSCWLLLCIFLVFCVYYIVSVLHTLILGPILAPVYIYISGKCHRGVESNVKESNDFEAQHKDMLDKNLLTSYAMRENPRYSAVLEHLNDGGREVEAAKAELEASAAAAAAAAAAAEAAKAAKAGAAGAAGAAPPADGSV